MSTEEKNKEIKIKKLEESKKGKNRYNISGSNEMKEESKNSSKISGEENKEIANLNISSQQKNTNSNNSKIIKENSAEIEDNKNSGSKQNNSISENNNQSQSKEQEENSEEKNESNSKIGEESSENHENDNSSFLNSRRYEGNPEENENDEIDDSKEEKSDNNCLKRKDPFMTTGKFMQIQPHFNIFSQRVENLREGIYQNTKKCLMYKGSLQYSENLMREKANSIVKDMVEKIFNMRKMFLDSNKEINGIISDTDILTLNLANDIDRNKKELNICQNNIHKCEGQIGYKLLGKPNYSFMKKTYSSMPDKKI